MRRKPCKDAAARAKWGRSKWFCAACGATEYGLHVLTTHEIIGGRGGRSFEPCNMLRLGMHPCHDLASLLDVPSELPTGPRLLPKITLAVALSLKLRSDPDEFDLDRIQELHGRPIEPEPIPEFFNALFLNNRPEFR